MVQEYFSPVRVHKYSFEMVMAAYERRFPSCPQIPVVIECVITEDSWSEDNSQRHTSRRCQLNVDAPYLLKKMIGVDCIYFLQKNHLDLKNRKLEIEATNESFAARVGVVEKCKYYVHPENPDWTCFEQSALLDVKNFFGLENTVEKIAMKQYAANIAKGKELIESFMNEVTTDGVTSLEPWSSDRPDKNLELRRVLCRGIEPITQSPTAGEIKAAQPGIKVVDYREPSTSSNIPSIPTQDPSSRGPLKSRTLRTKSRKSPDRYASTSEPEYILQTEDNVQNSLITENQAPPIIPPRSRPQIPPLGAHGRLDFLNPNKGNHQIGIQSHQKQKIRHGKKIKDSPRPLVQAYRKKKIQYF